jgi:hypothetical protein
MIDNKIDKADFDEIEGVIIKKIRNRKKKLEKIAAAETKLVSKEITATPEQTEMIASKDKIEQQIQELEEIRKGVHKECKTILTKHQKIVKNLKTGESNEDKTIKETLGSVADALLVNLLQNEYHVKDLVGKEETVGLEALMLPLKNLFTPPGHQLVYSRAKDCFLELFVNFVKGTKDIIPGSDTTYSKLLADIRGIPVDAVNHSYKLAPVVAAPVVHHGYVEETKEVVRAEPVHASAPREGEWNGFHQQDEVDDNDQNREEEDRKPTIEELVEEDVKRDMVKGVPEFKNKNKEFIDEDGFQHVKPHQRTELEHNILRGKGRRGGQKGRRGETQRLKVYGGKDPKVRGRGRGAHVHHDKHGINEDGKKIRTAHGKHSTWKQGEVRVDAPPTE